ncbi:MAG: hypothetical protein HY303_07445, partial [Candidatus Wallbacteria bacterium]|nr:hypothetical protein [Candidatus Wallbacteria bacterium]
MNVRRQLFRISRAGRDRATTRTTPLCIAVLAWLLAVLCGAFERPAASLPEARVTLTVLNGGDRERAQPESKRDKAVVDSEEELAAGASFRVVLEARARGPFPGPGQRLRVTLPYYHGYAPASIPQGDRPGSAGYTRITTGPAGASIRFIDPHLAPVVDVTAPAEFDVVFDRPMGAGESLRVVYGDGPEGAAIASELAVSRQAPGYKPFLCRLVDSGGEAGAVLARATPSVRAGPARSLRVIAPTVVRPGQPFRVRVVVLDRFGNRAESFRGVAAISGPGLQGRVPLGEAERGAGLASLLAPPEETILRLGARAGREPTVEGTSNPVLVRRGGDRVFFGDLHVHTGEASWDAYGSLDDVFTYARDTMGLDFVAGTDHDGDISADGFARLCALARHHESPGQFAAFTGFEWT